MSFLVAQSSAFDEVQARMRNRHRLLTFGVDYLDDAMYGIMPNDLVLLGARSGAGKTQFCCNVAMANANAGKHVHYIALEAEHWEIERRIKYQYVAEEFFKDPDRPDIDLRFSRWMMGDLVEKLGFYEAAAAKRMEKLTNLHIYYKHGDFGLKDMTKLVTEVSEETDLIIVDHVHYFDFDDENENHAMKQIAKTARMLTLEQGKPMILVSHLRKRDRFADDMVPGLEEFHGSSDLYKIATKAITLAPGAWGSKGKFETFFRIVKDRWDGSVTRYIASCNYIQREGRYEKGYRIGAAEQKRGQEFAELDQSSRPSWTKHPGEILGVDSALVQRPAIPNHAPGWQKALEDREEGRGGQ